MVNSTPALDGVLVLELGQIYAGPYCAHLLRSLGADVVVENFAEGVLERLGIGWETLHEIRPELVLASGRAYGRHPATDGLRGMDVTVQAMSGIVSGTGFPDGPPVKAGGAVADFAAGTHLATAVLAALFQRERTGPGQHVEVAMQDAIVPTLTSNLAGLIESGGDFPERTGNRHGGLDISPYNIYPAANGWVAILCLRPKHWSDLCRVMDRPDLAADPRLATPAGRVQNMDEVDAAVTAWTSHLGQDEVFRSLQQAGIPSAPVRQLSDVLHDPVLRDRGMLTDIGDRACTIFGSPLHLADSPEPETWPAPLLGEHTAEVLRDRLNCSDEQIQQLVAEQVI